MWTRSLQISRRRLWQQQLHRTVRFSRKYNGQSQGPHTTYFQPPPPKQPSRSWRIIRTLLWSTTCFGLGAYASLWAFAFDFDDLEGQQEEIAVKEAMSAGATFHAATQVPSMAVNSASNMLDFQCSYSIHPKAVAHTGQHGSNIPCEDTWSASSFDSLKDPNKEWYEWSIFDGHAGSRTSHVLKQILPIAVGNALAQAKCMNKAYVPNDWEIINVIKNSFRQLDSDFIDGSWEVMNSGGPLADSVAAGAIAFSGSCALMSLYDPTRSILRVANVGDSRAVIGRWDAASNKYVAVPMSVDQTGFNQDEVARLQREHPGEDVIDPKTGRVHGLAVTRAFGDARWKWTEEVTRLAHEKFWGPPPRPNGVIKTPPYLTAEPEIMETRINSTGDHPDFLIMASDGLWDNMTSDDAVACVQAWLDKNKSTDFLKMEQPNMRTWLDVFTGEVSSRLPTFSSPAEITGNDDTYYDEEERCRKWKVKPKHFVVEDTNCGVHMIKNALGGKRRDLFAGVMTVQPPLSRNVRDDITVHVVFFDADLSGHFEAK